MNDLPDIWIGPVQGGSAAKLVPVGHSFDLAGLSFLAMPPGRVDTTFSGLPLTVQICPYGPGSLDRQRVQGKEVAPDQLGAALGGFDLFARDAEIEIAARNLNWELLIEFDGDRAEALAAEDHDGPIRFDRPYAGGVDQPVRDLAALAIEHLRSERADPLFLEGLAIAIGARAVGLATGRGATTSTRGTDGRIARALDYVGDNLGRPLSVAELADVACMSPSWFARSFRAVTGQPVHAYMRERRLERALVLVREGRLPLAEVAYRCGFADQSHMGRAFRKRFGTTPAKARAG